MHQRVYRVARDRHRHRHRWRQAESGRSVGALLLLLLFHEVVIAAMSAAAVAVVMVADGRRAVWPLRDHAVVVVVVIMGGERGREWVRVVSGAVALGTLPAVAIGRVGVGVCRWYVGTRVRGRLTMMNVASSCVAMTSSREFTADAEGIESAAAESVADVVAEERICAESAAAASWSVVHALGIGMMVGVGIGMLVLLEAREHADETEAVRVLPGALDLVNRFLATAKELRAT